MTSPLHLEQQRHGELPPRTEDEAAVAALVVDDARVLERLPPATFVANVRARAAQTESTTTTRSPWSLAVPAMALCAAVAVVVVVPRGGDDDVTRLKGADKAPALQVFRQTSGGPVAYATGDVLGAGDTVQLRVVRGKKHGVIVSLDGAGHLTRHFPDGKDTALPAGGLPFSFELDDAPAFERFFLVMSDTPLDPAQIEVSVRSVAVSKTPSTTTLTVPSGVLATDVLVIKR